MVAAVAAGVMVLGWAWGFRERVFWDFRLCYAAGWLYGQGQNPYDNKLLFSIPALDPFPFAYPLPIAALFLPLTKLAFPAASMIWFSLTSLVLGLLVVLWWREFAGQGREPWIPLLALLVFNLAIPKALVTGNIVTLETGLLWAAFSVLAKGHLPAFAGLAVAAASFKLSPLVFLALPLVHPQTRRWKAVAVAAALFAVYLAVAYGMAPAWFGDYRANVALNVKEWSQADVFNPSTYPMSRRLVSIFLPGAPAGASLLVAGAVYGVLGVAVGWRSWRVARVLAGRSWAEAGRPLILYATLVYALLTPRMSDYSYILVIPAALYVAGTILRPPGSWWLIAGFLAPLPFVSFRDAGSGQVSGDFTFGPWGYWSLLMAFVCWHIASRHYLRLRSPRPHD